MNDLVKKVNPVAQGLIAGLLLVGFFAAMLMPGLLPSFTIDEAMKQTLITLTILAVGFYFGSSSESVKKNDTIAQQAQAANTLAAGQAVGNGPAGTPDDPVSVTEAPPTESSPTSTPSATPKAMMTMPTQAPSPLELRRLELMVRALHPEWSVDDVTAAVMKGLAAIRKTQP